MILYQASQVSIASAQSGMPHPVTSNYSAVPRLIGCRPYGAARNHGAGPDHIDDDKTPHLPLPHSTDQQQPHFSSLPP